MSANGFGRHPLMPHTRVAVGGPSTQVRAAIRRLYRVTNPIFAATGARVCRECRRQRTRDYKARQRAASLAAAALGLAA